MSLKDGLEPISIHFYPREENVGPIENAIELIKEKIRCVCHSVPYKKHTKMMIQNLVEGIIDMMNIFPSEEDIGVKNPPSKISEGAHKLDFSKKSLPFGAYAMAYIRTKNDMTQRFISEFFLTSSRNVSRCYFMSLYTRKRIHSYI